MGAGEMLLLVRYPPGGADAQSTRFAFGFAGFSCLIFFLLVLAILVLQLKFPIQGKLFLVALNIILLFSFPFGTILGIYYLVNVRKSSKDLTPAEATSADT